jgi:ABC-2 type transport system permease protein
MRYGVAYALAPWPGFAVMCGYALFVVGCAVWRLRRADA